MGGFKLDLGPSEVALDKQKSVQATKMDENVVQSPTKPVKKVALKDLR